MTRRKENSTLVYSTGKGRIESPKVKPKQPLGDGVLRVQLERKGRAGKTATTVSGVPLDGQALKDLARRIKQRCGTGGSVKEGVIVIQGDHRDEVMGFLKTEGFTVKRVGG